MKRLTLTLLFALLLTWQLGQAWGATYYVTQAGSGSADGSSYSNAMSVATHNAGSFSAGDTVYLCDNITSTIVVTDNGTLGSPILYDGACPDHPGTINVSIAVTGWGEPDGNGVYTKAGTNAVITFYEDNVPLPRGSSKETLTSGQWFSTYPDCYYKPTDGTPSNHKTAYGKGNAASSATRGLNLDDIRYITVKNLVFVTSDLALAGYETESSGRPNVGITITGNTFRYCEDASFFYIITEEDHDFAWTNNTYYRCGRNLGAYSSGTSSVKGLTIIGNTFIDPGSYNASRGTWTSIVNGGFTDAQESISGQNWQNAVVSQNTISGGIAIGIYMYVNAGGTFSGNKFLRNLISDTTQRGIYVSGENTSITTGNWFFSNLLIDTASTIGYGAFQWGPATDSGAMNYFANNTVHGADVCIKTSKGAISYLTAQNNICDGIASVNVSTHTTLSQFSISNNDYGTDGTAMFKVLAGDDTGSYSLSEWQGMGYDTHSINADPLFTSSTDFHLQPTSPALWKRATLGAPYDTDFDGLYFGHRGAPIGAYSQGSPRSRNTAGIK